MSRPIERSVFWITYELTITEALLLLLATETRVALYIAGGRTGEKDGAESNEEGSGETVHDGWLRWMLSDELCEL